MGRSHALPNVVQQQYPGNHPRQHLVRYVNVKMMFDFAVTLSAVSKFNYDNEKISSDDHYLSLKLQEQLPFPR